jgi:RNA polymerase sigma-70 factor (ECF subfamily)
MRRVEEACPGLPKPARSDDLELICAIARQDRHAFEALYRNYAPRLGRYLFGLLGNRETVEETVNDVMLVVWESAAQFNPATSRLSTWLFGIAHNKARKAFARGRQSMEIVLEADESARRAETDEDMNDAGIHLDLHDPEHMLVGSQLARALERALRHLSPEQRAVVELAFAEDLSYQEIAAITGCPVNTVKTRVFHARKRLAQLLEAPGREAPIPESVQGPRRPGRLRRAT